MQAPSWPPRCAEVRLGALIRPGAHNGAGACRRGRGAGPRRPRPGDGDAHTRPGGRTAHRRAGAAERGPALGGRVFVARPAHQRRVVRLPVPQRRELAPRAVVRGAGVPHRQPRPREGDVLGRLGRRGQLHLQQRLHVRGGRREPSTRAVGGVLQRQRPRGRPDRRPVQGGHPAVLLQVPLRPPAVHGLWRGAALHGAVRGRDGRQPGVVPGVRGADPGARAGLPATAAALPRACAAAVRRWGVRRLPEPGRGGRPDAPAGRPTEVATWVYSRTIKVARSRSKSALSRPT